MGEAFASTSSATEAVSEEEASSSPSFPRLSSPWLSRLLFLGTGTSGQVPAIGCVLPPPPPRPSSSSGPSTVEQCEACKDALRGNGFESKNRRGCCSVAVIGGGRRGKERERERARSDQGEEQHEDDESLILIDCGPTFYPSALRFFPPHKLRRITALLLTHGHADAILGLDSLRAWTMRGVIQSHVDVYCTQECFETVRDMFPYLVDSSRATGGGGVAGLVFHIISPSSPFEITDVFRPSLPPIQVQPLPLLHGFQKGPESSPFECLGFRIGELSYASDCHAVPPSTVELMRGSQVVVIDSLTPTPHPSHFSLAQALSFVCSMSSDEEEGETGRDQAGKGTGTEDCRGPKLALLTDITHRLEHRKTEAALQRWTKDISTWASLRYDGQDGNDDEHEEASPSAFPSPVAPPPPQQQPSEEASISKEASASEKKEERRGQGGGKRWWQGAWYEEWCESHKADLSLAPSAQKQLETASLNGAVKSLSLHKDDGDASRKQDAEEAKRTTTTTAPFRARSGRGWHVPEIHVAWDGLVIEWERSE